MSFSKNPLFTHASRAIRDSAKQAFRRSDFGRLLSQLEQAHDKPMAGPRELHKLIRAYESGGSRKLLQEVARSNAGRLARDLERYARRGSLGRKIVGQVISALGPAGKYLQALSGIVGPGGKPSSRAASLEAAVKLLQTFGYEVLPPSGRHTPETLERSLAAARAFLEEHGEGVPVPQPAAPVPERLKPEEGKNSVDVVMSNGSKRRFPLDHPIVTGKFVPATSSSNVHSFAFNVLTWELYVRFLGGEGESRHGPGPLYQYSHVPPELFLSLLAAGSKGNWVWDHLRIRGTVSGHQYDYRLAGITGGYVPRKATYTPAGEFFIPRMVRTDKGNGLASSKPMAPARGIPNRGRPNPPNRGQP